MKILKCKATLITDMLGTFANDPKIHDEYIASLAPDALTRAEEVASIGVDAEIEKSKTVFPRMDGTPNGQPAIFDYQIKGFMKEAAKALARISGSDISKTKAYIKIINELMFIYNHDGGRKIPINYDGAENGEVGNLQRPLRGQTAQGERITLANSEVVPAGAVFEFELHLLEPKHEKLVHEIMDYAKYKGFLQWRNSGAGRANITIA